MQGLTLALAFLLEIVAFIAFADLGLLLPGPTWVRIAAFITMLAAIILFWSIYMAPKSPKKLKGRQYYIAKGIIYALSAVSLALEQSSFLSIFFILAALFSEYALYRHNLS